MPALRSSEPTAAAAAAPAPPLPTDSLAELSDALAQGWRADLTPAATAIARFIEGSRSLEAARDGLAGLLPTLPLAHFDQRLTNALLQARLAGMLGVPVMDEELLQFAEAEPGRVQLKPLTDTEAVRYLANKTVGQRFSFDYRDVRAEEHINQFVVAKAMKANLLGDIHSGLVAAIGQGWSRDRFVRQLTPILQQQGWWGETAEYDPKTKTEYLARTGSPRRLKLIYDANIRTAHAAGRWERYGRIAEDGDLLRYTAVMDSRTRPEHAAWDGVLLPIGHPFWRTHYPPCGWNCRCTTILVPRGRVMREGLAQTPEEHLASKGYGQTYPWADPRRGDVLEVPRGIDPGWGYNVGQARERASTPTALDGPPPAVRSKRDLRAQMTNLRTPRPDLPEPRDAPRKLLPSSAALAERYSGFLDPFAGRLDKPGVFFDAAQVPIPINEGFLRDADGVDKSNKRGRGPLLPLLAETILDPDEIWAELVDVTDLKGKVIGQVWERRYIARWIIPGSKQEAMLVVLRENGSGWDAATALPQGLGKGRARQLTELNSAGRSGVLVWRRPT